MGRRNKNASKPVGSVLGLGDAGSSITNREGSFSPATAGTDRAQRRRRMSEGADELTPSTEASEHSGGHRATGIDMGSSGEGTDIE